MRLAEKFSHNGGILEVSQKGVYEEVVNLLDIPELGMARRAAGQIKLQIKKNLSKQGWVLDAEVHPSFNSNINAMKNRVGLTVQTGNIARAFYDLLKFQAMYSNKRIDACVLVVPTSGAAKALGSNIANFTRVSSELELFRNIITIPSIIIGIDE